MPPLASLVALGTFNPKLECRLVIRVQLDISPVLLPRVPATSVVLENIHQLELPLASIVPLGTFNPKMECQLVIHAQLDISLVLLPRVPVMSVLQENTH
jgi:hypothetical protein